MSTHDLSNSQLQRDRDDDEISLISMRELQPSPLDDSTYDLQLLSSSNESLDRAPSRLPSPPIESGRAVPHYLYLTQKYSSYAFASFLSVHACTAALSPALFGLDAGNSSLLLARTYFYQSHPYLEAALIPGALFVHTGSGLGLRAYRYYQQRKRYGGSPPAHASTLRWRNLSSISKAGYIMTPFLALHAGLLRVLPLWEDGDSSAVQLEFLTHWFDQGFCKRLLGFTFYGVFLGTASWHVVCGAAKYLKVSTRRRKQVVAAAGVSAGLWITALVTVVARSSRVGGWLGRHYDYLYRVALRRA